MEISTGADNSSLLTERSSPYTENVTTWADSDPHTAYTFTCAAFMLALCTIGAFGNVLSILVFTRRSMRSSINVLLTGLSVVDLSVLTSAVVVYVIPGLNAYSHFGTLGTLDLIMLFGLYQTSMIAQTCSVWTFVLISLERYLAVCHPFRAHRVLTIKRARCAQLGVAVFACLYNLCRFWEYSMEEVEGEVTYKRLLRDDYSYFIGYYTTSYVIVHFFAPFLLISILNALIVKAISKASVLRLTLAPNRNSTSNSVCNQSMTAMLKDAKRQSGITRMIVVVTLIFFFCNILPFVLNIWEALEPSLFDPKNPRSAIAYVTLDVSNILVVLNSSTNFVVYAIYCHQYRKLCRRYWRRSCRCGPWMGHANSNGQFDSTSDVSRLANSMPLTVKESNNATCLTSVVVRRQSSKTAWSNMYAQKLPASP